MSARSIEIDGVDVAYEVRGDGDPILLVHGWSADRRYMIADLEPVFAAHPGWQRWYLDLPGHGSTTAPAWLSSQDQMLRVVLGFAERAMPPDRFAIAGNSYGGFLTLLVARSIPERVRGAALLVPDVPAADGTRDLPPSVTLVPDPAIFDDLEPDEAWIPEALVVHERRMLDEIRAHDMPAYRVADPELLARLEASYLPTGAVASPGPPFPGPSLILTGRQDARVGYRAAWGLLEEFPRATYVTIDLGGHHLGRIERPALFGALVADWLDRLALDATTG